MQEFSPNWLSSFQIGDLGLETFVDDWKYWTDGWKVRSVYFDSMRNSGDFSNQDCKLERRDCYRALKRSHSWAQSTSVELEKLDTS